MQWFQRWYLVLGMPGTSACVLLLNKLEGDSDGECSWMLSLLSGAVLAFHHCDEVFIDDKHGGILILTHGFGDLMLGRLCCS